MLYDNDTFEHRGRTFTVKFPHDSNHGAPWEECDGHGIVSEWTQRDKSPGERLLHSDHHSKRYYDIAETTRLARKDGWGLSPENESKLAQALGRAPSKGEIIAAAVDQNFEYLRRWCNDDWQYVGVVVTFRDEDGNDDSESLWGVESDDNAYLESTAHELADEICWRLDEAMARDIQESRPDMTPAA